ncbi:MAG: FAD-dependent oxidoreductase, partial [Pseudomonadota bacterium]
PDRWNPKKAFQFAALDTAGTFWRHMEARTGVGSGYGRIGRAMPILTEDARALARSRQADATENWQGRYRWEVRDDALPRAVAPHGAVVESLAARIHPGRAVLTLAAACRRAGVDIRENTPVARLQSLDSDRVILAAGVGGFDLLAPFTSRHPGSGQKGQAALLGADWRRRPQVYADGLYLVPQDGGVLSVGSTSEGVFDHPTATDQGLDALLMRARGMFPDLARAPVLRRWAALRPKPRKRDPMLGPVPMLSGAFVALGAFKIGFGLAHHVGEVMAAAVIDGAPLPEAFSVAHHTGP